MSLYRNLITMLSASVLRSKPFDDVSDKNVQGSLESLNLKINTVAAQNVRLTTLGLPAASGSVLGDFIRLKDTAGVRSLDRGVSSTGAWIQSRSSSDYTVNYTLLLNPNGGTVATGGPVTVTGASASVSVGTNPSQSGAFRLANTQTIRWRNAANSADGFSIAQSAADALVIYDPSNNPLFTINAAGLTLPGPLTVGGFEVGTKIIPQSIKSVDYTLVLTDSGTHILHPTADTSTRTFTIPSNASVAFPAGTTVTFINQISAGNVYVDIVTDTMVLAGVGQTSSVLLAPNSIATALKVTTTQWLITLIDSQSLTLAQQQDLSPVTSASLHRSPNAVVSMFIYDTSKDSDGGAWVEKVGHTSWMNEPLNGTWLGAVASEAAARAIGGATTGDYYQLTNGKFYKLNAGSGATEVYRGNKAKFPRLAAIVAESGNVTIYDLTEPGRPMWMRFTQGSGYTHLLSHTVTSVAMLNGQLLVGCSNVAVFYGHIASANLPTDSLARWSGAPDGYALSYGKGGAVSTRNGTLGFISSSDGPTLVNKYVNAVAMTVLPDAPTDVSTGLQVPTIAVGTQGGTSFIRHDGTVVSSANPPAVANVVFNTTGAWVSRNGSIGVVNFFSNAQIASGSLTPPIGFSTGVPIRDGWSYKLAASKSVLAIGSVNPLLCELTFIRAGLQSVVGALQATVSDRYNTGYMVGIRRAYLCNTEVGTVTGSGELVTNGTFDTDISGWTSSTGTATSTAIHSSGVLRVTATGINGCQGTPIATMIGKSYKVQGEARLVSGGGNCYFGQATTLGLTGFAGSATTSSAGLTPLSFSFVATSTVHYVFCLASAIGAVAEFDNISCKEVIPDRSYKAAGANIFGTLTKSAVAPGAQLVTYSGFSAANYIQEPYSADLDFGVGELRVGGPVTVPVVLPVSSFPVIGATTVVNGDFAAGSANWTTQDGASPVTVVSGAVNLSSAGTQYAQQLGMTLGANKTYRIRITFAVGSSSPAVKVSLVTGNYLAGEQIVTGIQNVSGPTSYDVIVKTNGAKNGLIIKEQNANGSVLVVDDVSIMEVGPSIFVDRSAATGPKWSLGLDGVGMLVGTAFDGTTTRTVTTTTAYNSGTVIKPVLQYTTDGRLAIEVNGKEVAATTGTPLLTMNNAAAVLTIGNSRTLDAPFPGTISNQHIGATAATVEYAAWIYEQEKYMFRDGAQITLPAATSVLDLSYDESRDRWTTLQAGHESTFIGLIRTSVSTPSAGSFAKVSTQGGVKLISRTTTSPGVDITIPAISLRNEVLKTGTIPDKKLPLKPFEYDAVASQVDFPIPAGFVPIRVAVAGVIKREGSTKDYTLLHDGFIWTVRFAVAPGAAAWVQITPVLE